MAKKRKKRKDKRKYDFNKPVYNPWVFNKHPDLPIGQKWCIATVLWDERIIKCYFNESDMSFEDLKREPMHKIMEEMASCGIVEIYSTDLSPDNPDMEDSLNEDVAPVCVAHFESIAIAVVDGYETEFAELVDKSKSFFSSDFVGYEENAVMLICCGEFIRAISAATGRREDFKKFAGMYMAREARKKFGASMN